MPGRRPDRRVSRPRCSVRSVGVGGPVMTPPLPLDDSLSLTDLKLVIARCDQFEQAWESARPLRIEDLLTDAADPLRPRLFCELLRIELELRLRRGDRPTLDEYRTCFPSPADDARILAVFRQTLEAA